MNSNYSFFRRHLHGAFLFPVVALAGVFSLGLVATTAQAEHHEMAMPMGPTKAIAVLVAGNDSGVHGTVTFSVVKNGVRVVADVDGLTPGKHGFHVHELGDLSKSDLTSTGGHFNPEGHDHAGPSDAKRHVGDLGNLEANSTGHAVLDVVDTKIMLSGPHSILGRAVIIHAKADDMASQPTGAAGARVAGGVIAITK